MCDNKAESINILDEILKDELDDLEDEDNDIKGRSRLNNHLNQSSDIKNHLASNINSNCSPHNNYKGPRENTTILNKHGVADTVNLKNNHIEEMDSSSKDNTNSEMAKRNQFDGSDVSSSEDETQNSVLTHNSITSASFDSDSDKEHKANVKVEAKSPISGPSDSSSPKKDFSDNLSQILRDTRFFLMKSNNEENVELSKAKSVWSTPPGNEAKINQAVKETRNVILIFSVKESGQFSGFARVVGNSRRGGESIKWILPVGLSQRTLGAIFDLDWISKNELSFTKTQHLFNPWNEGKPVKIGRDGQEIEPHVAAELCRLFATDSSTDWDKVMPRVKEAATSRSSTRINTPIGSNFSSSFSSVPRGRTFAPRSRGRFTSSMPVYRTATARSFDNVRGRKRHFEDDFTYAARPKRARGSFEAYSGGYNTSDRYYRESAPYAAPQKGSSASRYQEFNTREYHQPPPVAPMPYPPPPPFNSLPPPPRYYDVPPLPDFPSSVTSSSRLAVRSRRSSSPYEKTVSDFIRRNGDRSHRDRDRSRDYDRKYFRH